MLTMAAECPAHDGMHLSEEGILLEIVGGKKTGGGRRRYRSAQ